jgi:hypothetical protein
MQPQKMAMELQVLRQENYQFAQLIKKLNTQIEELQGRVQGAHIFEQLYNSLLSGYSSQPRAASDPFWQKDNTSGTLIPLDGGPKWVVDQALEALDYAVKAFMGTSSALPESNESSEVPKEVHEAPAEPGHESPGHGISIVQS